MNKIMTEGMFQNRINTQVNPLPNVATILVNFDSDKTIPQIFVYDYKKIEAAVMKKNKKQQLSDE